MKTLQKSAMWLMALLACIQTTQIQAANKNGGGNGDGTPRSIKASHQGSQIGIGTISPRKIEVPGLGNNAGGNTERRLKKEKFEPIGGPPNLLNQNSATIALKGLNKSQLPFPGQSPPIIPMPGSGSPNPGTGAGNPNHPYHHHYFPWRNLVWHWNYPCPCPCGYTCGTVCVNGNWIGCAEPASIDTITLLKLTDETLTSIPVHATFRLSMANLNAESGVALIQVRGMTLPVEVLEWKSDSVVLQLPAMGLNEPAETELTILDASGTLVQNSKFLMVPAATIVTK